MKTDDLERPPGEQTIYITARKPELLSAEVVARMKLDHPEREGAQDLIIAAPDGRLYHVGEEDWKRHPAEPEPLITELLRAGTTLAYIPESAPSLKGCYLVNAAAINVDKTTRARPADDATVYRVEEKTWKRFVFRPGNSVLILDMLNKGATVAYVPKSARSTDCMCYLVNLATLNGSTIFEMSHTETCEIPAKE
jgi:hypothetical protein